MIIFRIPVFTHLPFRTHVLSLPRLFPPSPAYPCFRNCRLISICICITGFLSYDGPASVRLSPASPLLSDPIISSPLMVQASRSSRRASLAPEPLPSARGQHRISVTRCTVCVLIYLALRCALRRFALFLPCPCKRPCRGRDTSRSDPVLVSGKGWR